jgi:hypothetical protein
MPHACPGPSRRQLLQVGGASLLGLSLPRMLAADDRRANAPHADACIVVFLNGGPSHLDMWDMKPDAPAEVRGPFKPIATTVPGVQLSEHLPRLARQMHHCALIRSAHHSVNNAHAAAVYAALTGHDRGDVTIAIGAGPNDYPAVGSVVSMLRPPGRPVVGYVSMPYITQEGAGGPPQPGFHAGVLGRNRDPLFVLRDPNAAAFALPELAPGPGVDPPRLVGRRGLLDRIGAGATSTMREMTGFQGRAFDLLASPATQQAFRIDREPDRVRERYGRNIYGQSVLLARRLIEAGTRVACISWAPDANATWDTHGQNFVKLKDTLLPQLDAAVSSLLDDLHDRGMLRRTLVAVMGEFGRTPKVNNQAGRDHWNFCYGLLLAGGGVRAGYVHGASDRIGARPSRNPVTPGDIVATIYHCLGIEPETEISDRLSRPFVLVPSGGVIRELLA